MRETEHEVATWYAGYIDTFIALAKGERDDLGALVRFFATPCTVVTNEEYKVLADEAAVTTAMRTEVDRMRARHYATSALLRQDLHVLNPRAALVEAVFSREDRDGRELLRFEGSYLAAKTPGGWRFAAMIIASP